ncbi:DUF177 domain-containing protein [Ramlibacter sp.]|uniref:YceD family protein n=1 Tax=Ramlibacter sp. TaxID=1917967 RepID=UPI0035AF0F04
MEKPSDPRRLDIRRLAEREAVIGGELPLQDLPRLREEAPTAEPATPVVWQAWMGLEARAGGAARPTLRLEARTTLPLTCQRCLQPVAVALAVDRAFRFEADEAAAAAEDEFSDEVDVLVESRRFDLLELLEDELVMALPVVPRHDTCPAPVTLSSADPGFEQALRERENPFAALAKLKAGSGGTGL